MTTRLSHRTAPMLLLLLAGCEAGFTADTHVPLDEMEASLATPVPGRIQAEAYNGGGEGVGYHDTTAGNAGGAYASDDVDIEITTDTGGGYNVGWIAAGEWLRYNFNVSEAGTYEFKVRVASAVSGTKTLHAEIDGFKRPAVSFTDASGWQSWKTISLGQFKLGANIHSLKVVADTGGFNLNHVDISLVSGGCGDGTCDAAAGESATSCVSDCCVPTTCAATGTTCGSIPDGCGGTLSCGPTCSTTKGMKIVGNVLTKDGAAFYPRGFNMIGLLGPDGCPNPKTAPTNARKAFGKTELLAARDQWAANTVRFQVSQRGMDPKDPIFLQSYVDRVKAGVQLARSLGLVVIVSMQDQIYGCGFVHPMPSAATLRGWSTVVPLFKADPYVMFELFNEPQSQVDAASWEQWKNGGTSPIDNLGEPAVGHQQLVKHVRSLGAQNVLIADGANYAGKLQGVPLLSDTLADPQIMYAVHPYYFHVYDNASLATDQANWDTRFGYLTSKVPVIATEWNAHNNACHAGADARIPDLFAYLVKHRIGLMAHAFDIAGLMVKDLTTWTPTDMSGYACDVVGYDAGELVQAHYKQLAANEPTVPTEPEPQPEALNLYFGNTHSHSQYSDGDGTPADHFSLAKQNGYDFYVLTDHSLPKYPGYTVANHEDSKKQAAAYTDSTFVGLVGFEFSENSDPAGTGHINGINTDTTVDASASRVTLATFYDWLVNEAKVRPTVASFNHASPSTHNSFGYLTVARREVMALFEVFNQKNVHYPALIAALDKGWRVSPIGGMDNHGVYGITNFTNLPTRTGVWAESLTADGLVSAMRQRRTYGTIDSNLRVRYTVNGQMMGSVLSAPSSLAFAIEASDPDTGVAQDAITKIDIVTEAGAVVASKTFGAHAVKWAPTLTGAKKYYLVRVYTQERTDPTAYAAPIWIEP